MPIGVYERPTYKVLCSVCGKEYTQKRKPVDNPKCKVCQKKLNDKKYYENNKEKYKVDPLIKKERDKKYYENHKEIIKERNKRYYDKNREKILEQCTQYRRSRGELPNGMSGTEKIALTFIQELFPNTEIRTKDRKTLKSPFTNAYLELDFYIPSLELAIELNGPTHYKPIYGKEKFERQQRNDKLKRELCDSLGITLIEIPLEEGVHYDRFKVEHARLRETIYRFIRFREDKNKESCIWKDHIHK